MKHNSRQETIGSSSEKTRAVGFPMLLIIRWAMVAALVIIGFQHLFILVSSWSYWTERMVIDPTYSPYPWLFIELSVLAVAALLWLRSKWVFVPIALHIGLFARQLYAGLAGRSIPWQALEVWAAEEIVLGFCLWLLISRKLR